MLLCSLRSSPTIMDKELRPSSCQNDITGDHIITKVSSKAYRSGYDRIFGKKKEQYQPNIESSHDRVDKLITKLGGYYDHKSNIPEGERGS